MPASGLTIVEMMATLAIASILMMLVAPGFADMIANNRLRTEVYALRATLMKARSDAMTERNNVSFCASDNGESCSGDWNEGYIAFFDEDEDGVVDDEDRIVESRTTGQSSITIAYSNPDDFNYVLYNSRGNALIVGKNFNGTFTFCDQRGAKKAAGLIVSRVGNITAAVDSDDDEIVNDDAGNLVCP